MKPDSSLNPDAPGIKRVWLRWLMAVPLMGLLLLTASYHWVSLQGAQGLYHDLAQVPYRSHAMLLGTAPTIQGRPNAYYTYRLKAAAALWHAGKYGQIIVSGSRRMTDTGLYDEIAAMRRDLVAAGVPADRILADPDAHRTRLSVEHAPTRFGLTDYLIITQAFHCERSLFIAHDLGQTPLCYAAEALPYRWLMLARELASRAVAISEHGLTPDT